MKMVKVNYGTKPEYSLKLCLLSLLSLGRGRVLCWTECAMCLITLTVMSHVLPALGAAEKPNTARTKIDANP